MTKEELFNSISNCRDCNFKYGKIPFFFPMKEQKVMLITACPSIQAMFRPLTSIRFFRTISVALFGDANISPEYIRALHDEIYWTHMNKCYNQEALTSGDFNQIPEDCMKVYINEEVRLKQPEIIIAFGKIVAERLFQKELGENKELPKDNCVTCSKWGAKVIISDFPATGTENHLDTIRNELVKMSGFKFMERHENGNWTVPYKSRHETAKGLQVNLDFEREAIEHLNITLHGNSNENSWLKNVVLPNMKNCEAVARLEFFIEDQIRTMLMEVFSHSNNWMILEGPKLQDLVKKTPPLDQNTVYDYLKDNWKDVFKSYLIYLIEEKKWNCKLSDGNKLDTRKINELSNKLRSLSKIRNHIVHNGGYAPPDLSRDGGWTRFDGIRWYVNLVYVSNEGIESVSKFAKEIIKIVSAHNFMRFEKPKVQK